MRRLSYNQVKASFAALGLELLSTEYLNGRSPLAYRCRTCGFTGRKSGQDVGSGYGCPRCSSARVAASRKASINEACERFGQRGLRLLSPEYSNSVNPLKYVCLLCGYQGQLSFARAAYRGCKRCATQRRSQLRMLTPAERSRRLKPNVKMRQQGKVGLRSQVSADCCKCGHFWRASLVSVIEVGCPRCSRENRSAHNAYSHAKAASILAGFGFELLSPYVSSQESIRLRGVECGHVFESTFNNATQAKGCPRCARNARKTDQDYLDAARRFGGQLLLQGSSSQADSKWKCALGHDFERSLTSINALGTFCTECSSSYSEMLCKAMLERLFERKFSKVRLKKMRSIKGRPLELDFYNKKLRLAVEHNGAHHYEPQKNWTGEAGFEIQKANDEAKRQFCKATGILLVEIRELGIRTSVEEARQQLFQELTASGRAVPEGFLACDLSGLVVQTRSESYWDQVKSKARSLGLEILRDEFLGSDVKVLVRCEKVRHLSSKTPRSIKNGEGCRECFLQNLRRQVFTSDGRTYPSGADCARALGVRKETVNRAARTGVTVRGLKVSRTKPKPTENL